MKRFRLIPGYAAVAALVLLPVLCAAQTEQSTDTSAKAEKKAKRKAKKTEQTTGETTGAVKGQETATPETPKAPKAKTGSAQRTMPTPSVSESDIAAAKASGKVWVNTETGVYHKGGRWYGATKQGKFMTEDDAIKAGYRASKGQ
ncbi:MAG TPA: hypothetical protein VKB88_02155 [Bryobacteraceae bacterium]|nr:hypothetical protein [Bryobacteraceae bacterium]